MKLITSLIDDQYPKATKYKTRIAARAVVYNTKGEIALTHLLADDQFGHRDYFELPGGGKKVNEVVSEAVLREVNEELGVEGEIKAQLGIVHDFYNLISQENYSYYYLVKVNSIGTRHLEERESRLIDKMIWIDIHDAVEIFEKQLNINGVGLLVARREFPIITIAANLIDKDTTKK